MNIWKLGCNWGTGEKFFDEFLRTEKIILGWTNHNYDIDDIVLIAKGHNIIALTKVIGERSKITSNLNYKTVCEEHKIDYCDNVYYTKVEWIDLKKEDYFKYQLQQGICNVRNSEIQNIAISLFEKYKNSYRFRNNQLFKLHEIANWQIKSNESMVKLPTLQRGFVWKAKQIEDLWDSLLRGFPIGSFLLSDDDSGNYFLMDGQQRATSIFLGFNNPWQNQNVETWSLKHIPTLWIDIDPREKTETHLFVFRILTQSHPWGYQRKNNNIPLTIAERNKALVIFEENETLKDKGYTSYPSTLIFPYDADLPIPVSFVIGAFKNKKIDFEDWRKNLLELCKEFIPEFIKTKGPKFDGKENYLLTLSESNSSLSETYNSFSKLFDTEIHSNVIKKEILTENQDGNAENPTLFIRLNSSGTPLNGDELIYSIYKAYFPASKDLIEKIGLTFISAPTIISMIARIAQTEIIEGNEFVKKFDVRMFQNRLKEDIFTDELNKLIQDNENSNINLAFTKAIEILKFNDIPDVLVKDLVKKNQELFLLLIYWLYKHHNIEIDVKKRVAIQAKFTILSWFGIKSAEFVKKEWMGAKDEKFWTKEFSSEQAKEYIACIIPPENLEYYFKNENVIKAGNRNLNLNKFEGEDNFLIEEVAPIVDCISNHFGEIYDEQRTIDTWNVFFNKLFWNRSFIIFAQRKYINEHFKDFNQIEDLQDTNVPWDWDHIYPDSWVYYQQTFDIIRRWNNCIGNFRALSLGQNRSENNNISPKVRFKESEERERSFIKSNDLEFWNQIDDRIKVEKLQYHTKAIVYRTINIYKEWYDTLKINNVFKF